MPVSQSDLKLSVQRALLQEVPDNLYAVTAGFDERGGIIIRGYYFSEPTEQDRIDLSCVGAEVIADWLDELPVAPEESIHEECVDASNLVVLEGAGFWALIKSRKPNDAIRFTPPAATDFPASA